MLNVFIIRDPLAPDDPCAWIARPDSANLDSIERNLLWKIVDSTGSATWDPASDPPIVFGDDWTGSKPAPQSNPAGPPFYTAQGPAAPGRDPVTYKYTIQIAVNGCGVRVIAASVVDNPRM